MKKREMIFLVILACSKMVFASEKLIKYEELQKSQRQNPMMLIEVLLRPFGSISDFKVTDESVTSEVCIDQMVIRAKVSCNKKEKIKTHLYFAEGNGLLCKINGDFAEIKCVLTEKNSKRD